MYLDQKNAGERIEEGAMYKWLKTNKQTILQLRFVTVWRHHKKIFVYV